MVACCLLFGFLAGIGHSQMIVAHRGASHDAPENTLAAFHEAWKQGADGIEGDFYLTEDRHIVCIHDKNTKRTGSGNLDVATSRLTDLRELEVGSWKAEKFRGELIPTFAEVLNCVPAGKTFVIELKSGPEIVPVLAKELKSAQVDFEKLLVISFNADTISMSKKMLPNVRAHWLAGYQRDKFGGSVSPTASEISDTLRVCRADGLGTQGDRSVVTQEFIAELQSNGLREFHVWTVDAPEDAAYYHKLGAMGITTNRPQLIRESLDAQ